MEELSFRGSENFATRVQPRERINAKKSKQEAARQLEQASSVALKVS